MSQNKWTRDRKWEMAIEAQIGIQWKGERPRAWRKGQLAALVSRDEIAPGDPRWHISLQHADRVPDWNELAEAGHALRPGVIFIIGVPPRSWWLNVHERVLHLYETCDEHLIEQWRFESRGDEPT